MTVIVKGNAKEVATLIREIQGRPGNEQLVMIRKPYTMDYSLVRLGEKGATQVEDK
ncbi:MAG: hypothetical protein HFF11_02845 [Angelakisella sp.]|jgi:hypothetical protein|nr:hypothetical protein [Angelakisella sp.]